MAARDYMTASPDIRGREARKNQVRISQKPDAMQHTSGQKLVFTKSHNQSNFTIAKYMGPSLDPGFGFWPHQQRLVRLNAASLEGVLCAQN